MARALPILLMFLSATASGAPVPDTVRQSHKIAARYVQYSETGGQPIVAAKGVSPFAMAEAAWIAEKMLGGLPEVRAELKRARMKVVVLGINELVTELPEFRFLRPREHWDLRARALGGNRFTRTTLVNEENLLGYRGEGHARESTTVHELAHTIHVVGMPWKFDVRVRAIYDKAMAAGRWAGTYAARNHREYWAVGVQCWFDAGAPVRKNSNGVRTREGLQKYDPPLAALVRSVFGDMKWRWSPAKERAGSGHLSGYDPRKAPRFIARKDAIDRVLLNADGRTELTRLADGDLARRRPVDPTRHSSLLIINRSAEELKLLWVGPDGTERTAGKVAAGQRRHQASIVGHAWRLVDTRGRTVALVQAAPKPGLVTVEKPSPQR
jgi:hypothetical protein